MYNSANAAIGDSQESRQCEGEDRLRTAAYILVATAAFVAGILFGNLGAVPGSGSRGEWPKPAVAHPRSLDTSP